MYRHWPWRWCKFYCTSSLSHWLPMALFDLFQYPSITIPILWSFHTIIFISSTDAYKKKAYSKCRDILFIELSLFDNYMIHYAGFQGTSVRSSCLPCVSHVYEDLWDPFSLLVPTSPCLLRMPANWNGLRRLHNNASTPATYACQPAL